VRVNDVAAELLRQALGLLELKPCDEDQKVQASLLSASRRIAGLATILAGHAERASWLCCATCGGNGRIGDDISCWDCGGVGYLPPKAIPPTSSAADNTQATIHSGETPSPPEPPPTVRGGTGGG